MGGAAFTPGMRRLYGGSGAEFCELFAPLILTLITHASFVVFKVKTLSFLTYLLRAFAEIMRPYQESIPK